MSKPVRGLSGVPGQLFRSTAFVDNLPGEADWDDDVFQYCEFSSIQSEGGVFGGVYLSCTFEACSWYWGLFATSLLVDVTFRNCRFRGTAFSGSRFVNCSFERCVFESDNLDAPCRFIDVSWFKCTQVDCIGLSEQFRNR